MMKTNGYSNKERLARKARLRQEAEERNQRWAALTTSQKIAELNRRGLVATKQRQKLGV